MKKTKVYLVVIIMAAFATLNACKKGDTGPAGTDGTNGTNGNANMTNTIASSLTWNFVGTSGLAGNYYETTVNDSDITATVVGSGAILVYYKDNVITDYHQLPMTMNYPAYTRSYNTVITTGQVKIQIGDSDGNSQIPVGVSVRIVVIPSASRIGNLPYKEMLLLYHLDENSN